MARKEIGTKWDRVNRNNMNDNFKELYNTTNNFVEKISEEAFGKVIDASKLVWKEPVDSQSDLPSSASEGDTRMARDSGKVYRFDGSEWKEIQQLDSSPINEVDERLSSQLAETEQKKADKTEITRIDTALAQTIKRDETGALDLNVFDEPTRNILQGQETGTINAVLGVKNVKNINLDDESVGVENTDFVIRGKNILDVNHFTPGYRLRVTDGEPYEFDSHSISDFINIKPNTNYARTRSVVGFYDANKKYIDGLGLGTESFTTPPNAYFMRVSVQNSELNISQIEEGTVSTQYEPYFIEIPNLKGLTTEGSKAMGVYQYTSDTSAGKANPKEERIVLDVTGPVKITHLEFASDYTGTRLRVRPREENPDKSKYYKAFNRRFFF